MSLIDPRLSHLIYESIMSMYMMIEADVIYIDL